MIDFPDIRRFKNNEPFYITDKMGKIHYIDDYTETYYYYELWENYHHFGLPHGKGWLDELPWVVDFLKFYDKIWNEIENYRIKKRGD